MNLNKILLEVLNLDLKINNVNFVIENRDGELDPEDVENNISDHIFPFRARSNENKLTAPEMAYSAVHNKNLQGKRLFSSDYQHKKVWKNMLIDNYIDENVLNQIINNLSKIISVRAVSQGHSKERPTYIILRTCFKQTDYNKFILTLKKLENENNPIYKIKYDIGNSNYYRICIAGNIFYDEKENKLNTIYHEWWDGLYSFLEKGFK